MKNMTPKIIHQIWVGEEPSEFIKEAMKSIEEMNPDFEYMFWDNQAIKEFNCEEVCKQATQYAFCANILRLKILKKYGGIYIDADFEAVQPIDNLYKKFQSKKLASNFIKDQFPDVGIIIAEPNIDYHLVLADYQPNEPIGFLWQRMKPAMITEEEVGINGSILKDLRLNSWVNP